MKMVAWLLAVTVAMGVIGGLVYLGTKEFSNGSQGTQQNPSTSKPINNPEAGSGKQTYHLNVDGYNREFIVYRPDDINESEEVPVVFMFHGSGQTGEQFYKETGWKQKADEEGFMVVYPTGMKYHLYADEIVQYGVLKTDQKLYQTKWNSFELPQALDPDFPDQVLHDDVKFTREIVNFLGENYAVDQTRFYATGFSNGGQFTTRLRIVMSDVFAAFAPTSGGSIPDEIMSQVSSSANKPENRPVIFVAGADDDKAMHAAGVEELSHDESAAQDGNWVKDRYIANYLEIQGLADEYVYKQVGGAAHFTYGESLSGENNEFQMIVADGMGHIYPNGKNFRFDAADVFWPFFEKYSL